MKSRWRFVAPFFFLISSLRADLPGLFENEEWLGYFVAWEQRNWEFGFGDEGKGSLYPKKAKKRITTEDISIYFRHQLQRGDQWESHNGEWNSSADKGLNPKKPIPVTVETKNGTKVRLILTRSGNEMMIKPAFLENPNKGGSRLAITFEIKPLDRALIGKNLNEKELKKALRGNEFEARRAKDGKKITYPFHEQEDILGNDFLAEGASEISLRIRHYGKTLELTQGDPKLGRFEIIPTDQRPLHLGFRIVWLITAAETEKKDAFLSFTLK